MKSFPIKNNPFSIFTPTNIKLLSVMFLAALFLSACGSGGQDRIRQEQLNELKESTMANLNSIIDDIDERIEFLDEEIENASGDREIKFEDARAELKDQKELVEEEKENIEDATLENWNDVIENTSQTTARVRAKTNEISQEVRKILEN